MLLNFTRIPQHKIVIETKAFFLPYCCTLSVYLYSEDVNVNEAAFPTSTCVCVNTPPCVFGIKFVDKSYNPQLKCSLIIN